MISSLAGRGAIVTGGSLGIGFAIARAYVIAGADVLICARSPADVEAATAQLSRDTRPGQIVCGQVCDVSDGDAVGKCVAVALDRLGTLDILVNAAGVQGPIGPVEEVDWREWCRAIEINLMGSVLTCRAVLPHFRANGYGKIIQLSGGGATSPRPRFSAYAAAKAAVVRFAETLAVECRNSGIDVNAMAPGAVNTRLLDAVLMAGPERVGEIDYRRSIEQKTKGGTPPEHAAELAVFLASAASDGISGRLISAVWDDWRALPQRRAELDQSDIFTLRRITPEDRQQDWPPPG